jgi:hypothetical protein
VAAVCADLEESGEPCETVAFTAEGEMSVMKESLTPHRRDREDSLAALTEKSPQKRITIEFG